MTIDFNDIEEKIKPHFKGGEKEYRVRTYLDNENRIMRGVLKPGASIGYHKHELNSEVMYIISGKGHVLYDQGEEDVAAGQVTYCPKGHSHSLVNNGDEELVFLGIVGEHHD